MLDDEPVLRARLEAQPEAAVRVGRGAGDRLLVQFVRKDWRSVRVLELHRDRRRVNRLASRVHDDAEEIALAIDLVDQGGFRTLDGINTGMGALIATPRWNREITELGQRVLAPWSGVADRFELSRSCARSCRFPARRKDQRETSNQEGNSNACSAELELGVHEESS